MDGLLLVTAPTSEPVTLTDIKTHCRVDFPDDDTLLQDLLGAARELVERETARSLLSTTWKVAREGFPACADACIALPRSPLQSISSVTYRDSAGVVRTVSSSVYGVDCYREPGRLYLMPSQSWPATQRIANAVLITFVAGWASAGAVPGGLKQAIKLLVGHWYGQREATVEKGLLQIPLGVARLIALHRIPEAA